jgi:hypothetical protein
MINSEGSVKNPRGSSEDSKSSGSKSVVSQSRNYIAKEVLFRQFKNQCQIPSGSEPIREFDRKNRFLQGGKPGCEFDSMSNHIMNLKLNILGCPNSNEFNNNHMSKVQISNQVTNGYHIDVVNGLYRIDGTNLNIKQTNISDEADRVKRLIEQHKFSYLTDIEILSNVMVIVKDQAGCRFLQSIIEASPETVSPLFKEVKAILIYR